MGASHYTCFTLIRGPPPPPQINSLSIKSIPWGGGVILILSIFSGGGGWRALSFDKSILSRGQINFQPTPIFVNKNSSFALPELAFVNGRGNHPKKRYPFGFDSPNQITAFSCMVQQRFPFLMRWTKCHQKLSGCQIMKALLHLSHSQSCAFRWDFDKKLVCLKQSKGKNWFGDVLRVTRVGQVSKKLPVGCQVTFKVWQLGDFRMHSKSGLPRSVETIPANRAIVSNIKIIFFQEADSCPDWRFTNGKASPRFSIWKEHVQLILLNESAWNCSIVENVTMGFYLLVPHLTSLFSLSKFETSTRKPWDFLKNHRLNELNKSKEEVQKWKESRGNQRETSAAFVRWA